MFHFCTRDFLMLLGCIEIVEITKDTFTFIFYQKYFCDKMDLGFFYFHVTIW